MFYTSGTGTAKSPAEKGTKKGKRRSEAVSLAPQSPALFDKEKPMSEMLRPYVRRIMQEKGLTVMGVAEGSGGQMSPELLDDIRQGDVKDLSDVQVKALARGLGKSEDDVRAVLVTPS